MRLNLSFEICGELVGNALASSEQCAAGHSFNENLVDNGSSSVQEVKIASWHSAMDKQSQKLLDDNADLGTQ